MIIEVLKNETFDEIESLPQKGTEKSTGYDIIATSDPIIIGVKENSSDDYLNIQYIEYKTNLKFATRSEKIVSGINKTIDINYDVLAFPRSSVRKYNLVLANSIGLIDQDYRGEIVLCFKYIWQPEDYSLYKKNNTDIIKGKPNFEKMYKKGDKICQLKVTKIENVDFILVNDLEKTNRGNGGFGSTDDNNEVKKAKQQMSLIENLYNNIAYTNEIPKRYIESVRERELK